MLNFMLLKLVMAVIVFADASKTINNYTVS
jgi:hypothetical protein